MFEAAGQEFIVISALVGVALAEILLLGSVGSFLMLAAVVVALRLVVVVGAAITLPARAAYASEPGHPEPRVS